MTTDAGDLIPGSKGLRKIRIASGGKGKRGGSRVIYDWYVTPEKIQFCRICEKSSQANLSKDVCTLLGVSLATIRKWERGTGEPSGAAKTLVAVASLHPEAIREALAVGKMITN